MRTLAPRTTRNAFVLSIVLLPVIALVSLSAAGQSPADRRDWIQLFNGKSLDGWVPKITGYPLGENYADTFRVVNGALQASYDKTRHSRANSAIFSTNVRSSPTTSSPPSIASSASR